MAHTLNLLPPADAGAARRSGSLGGALVLLCAALVLLSSWVEWDRRRTLADEALAQRQHAEQRAQWQARLGRDAAAGNPQALQQELAAARAELARLQAEFLQRVAGDAAPAAWLDWLATHWPAQSWLQRVRAGGGRIDIEGYTLAPAELRGWMQHLATSGPQVPLSTAPGPQVPLAAAPGPQAPPSTAPGLQAPLQLTGLRLEQRDVAPWGRVYWFEVGARRVLPSSSASTLAEVPR
jgi:hypothetical protein